MTGPHGARPPGREGASPGSASGPQAGRREPLPLALRLEEIASRAAPPGDRVVERPRADTGGSAARVELGALRAEVSALRAEISSLRGGIEALTASLAGELQADRAQTGALLRRIEGAAATALAPEPASRVDLTPTLDRFAVGLAALTGQVEALGVEVLTGSTQAWEAVSAEVGRLMQEVSRREAGDLAALRIDVADALEEVRSEICSQVASMGARLAPEPISPTPDPAGLDGLGEALEGLLDRHAAGLRQAVETTRAAVDDGVATARQRWEAIEASLADLTAVRVAPAGAPGPAGTDLQVLGRLLREAVADVTGGLAPGERRSLADRVEEAVARRRDAEDAARWRAAHPQASAEDAGPRPARRAPQAAPASAPAEEHPPARPSQAAAPSADAPPPEPPSGTRRARPARSPRDPADAPDGATGAVDPPARPAAGRGRRRPQMAPLPEVNDLDQALDRALDAALRPRPLPRRARPVAAQPPDEADEPDR